MTDNDELLSAIQISAANRKFDPLMAESLRLQSEAARHAVAPIDTSAMQKAAYERAIQGQQQQMAGMALASATPEYRGIAGHTYQQGSEAQGPTDFGEGIFTPGHGYVADPHKARDRLTKTMAAQAEAARQFGSAYGQQEDREAGRAHQAAVLAEQQRHARAVEGHAASQAAAARAAGKLIPFKDANDNPMFYDVHARQVINPMAGQPGAGAAGGIGGKPPGEMVRQLAGIDATGTLLDRFQTELKDFNPRSPIDVLNPTKRARMDSLGAQLSMNIKEAMALGALTGPDLGILADTLAKPGGWMAAFYGREGINEQLGSVRQGMADRRRQLETLYPRLTGTQPAAPSAAPAAPPVQRRTVGGRSYVFDGRGWKPE